MRKLLRAKYRHMAEQNGAKTIKAFRYLWKQHLKKLGRSVAIHDRRKSTKKYAW